MEERGYEDRWSRGRGRDDWDAYGSIPPAPLPPHVAAGSYILSKIRNVEVILYFLFMLFFTI